MKNADTPATASHHFEDDNLQGLTKREAFLMAAMHGMLSNSSIVKAFHDEALVNIKQKAYFLAGLMLEDE